jgi:hypothetical protein
LNTTFKPRFWAASFIESSSCLRRKLETLDFRGIQSDEGASAASDSGFTAMFGGVLAKANPNGIEKAARAPSGH